MPVLRRLKFMKKHLLRFRFFFKFFLHDGPSHSAIIDHAPLDSLFNLGKMPLDTIMYQVVVLNPHSPQNGGPNERLQTPNILKSPGDAIRKNALLPVDGSPSSTAPRAIR